MTRLLVLLNLIFITTEILGQFKVSGTIREASDKSKILGATLMIKDTKIGTISDENGYFELESESVPFTLEIHFIGFLTENIEISQSTKNLNIYLSEDIELIEEIKGNSDKIVKHVLDVGYLGDVINAPIGLIANYSIQSLSNLRFDINTSFKYWSNQHNNKGTEFSINKDLTNKINYLPDNLHFSITNIEYFDIDKHFKQYRSMLSNEWRNLSFSYGGSYSELSKYKKHHFSLLAGFSMRSDYYGLLQGMGLNSTVQYHRDKLYYDFGIYKNVWLENLTTISIFAKFFSYEEDLNGIMISLRFSIFNTRYYCCSSWKPFYHSMNTLK